MPLVLKLLYVLSGLVVVATALPFVPGPHWWARAFDFPRLQVGALAFATLAALGVVVTMGGAAPWWVLALVAAAGLVQLYEIVPYTPVWRVQSVHAEAPAPERALCVVVSNVLMQNRDVERWARVVPPAEPDVIAVVEVDAWWTGHLGPLLAAYPHRVEVPQPNTYGMAVYSRLPLEDVEVRHLVEETVPSVFCRVVLPSGRRVRLVVVHPRPPRPELQQGSEFRDAELVLVSKALGEFPERERAPVLVAGDLNDVAWSRTTRRFQKLSGLLDPRVGRGLFPTFHARYPVLRWPLDHVFHSDDLALAKLTRLPYVGSDHFPMLIRVALAPEATAQAAPEPEADDVEAAVESVEEAREVLQGETPREARQRDVEDR